MLGDASSTCPCAQGLVMLVLVVQTDGDDDDSQGEAFVLQSHEEALD